MDQRLPLFYCFFASLLFLSPIHLFMSSLCDDNVMNFHMFLTDCCLPLGTTWREEQQQRIATLHLSLLIRGEIVGFGGRGGGQAFAVTAGGSALPVTSKHSQTHIQTYLNCFIFVCHASLFEMTWNDFPSLDVQRKLSFEMTWNLSPRKHESTHCREYFHRKRETVKFCGYTLLSYLRHTNK